VGLVLATMFVVDALMPQEMATRCFPWLHYPLTFNYTYRGGWGTLVIIGVLFLVSAFTKKTAPEKLATTTIAWGQRPEPFRGLVDWRLQWGVLAIMTVAAYWWLW
jgi:solute:Na+ symporter, SSS family